MLDVNATLNLNSRCNANHDKFAFVHPGTFETRMVPVGSILTNVNSDGPSRFSVDQGEFGGSEWVQS